MLFICIFRSIQSHLAINYKTFRSVLVSYGGTSQRFGKWWPIVCSFTSYYHTGICYLHKLRQRNRHSTLIFTAFSYILLSCHMFVKWSVINECIWENDCIYRHVRSVMINYNIWFFKKWWVYWSIYCVCIEQAQCRLHKTSTMCYIAIQECDLIPQKSVTVNHLFRLLSLLLCAVSKSGLLVIY